MNTVRQLAAILAFATGAGTAGVAGTDPIPWMTNETEAMEESLATNRPVLMFFTGSDWCVWSQKMEDEIFNTPEFASYARDHLVLLKLAFPRSYQLPEAQIKHNRALQKKYDISGYPAIVVTDNQGRIIGRLSYRDGGPQPFLGELSKMIE